MFQNVESIIKMLKVKHRENQLKIDLSNVPKCESCDFILNNPHQTSCGCLYCKECIESLIIDKKCCPGGSEECNKTVLKSDKTFRADKARSRDVLQVKVKCVFDGCETMVAIKDLSDHLGLCGFKTTQCKLCQEDVMATELNYHQKEECDEREVSCDFCHGKMKSYVLMKEHNNPTHKDVCIQYIDNCPYTCGENELVCISEHMKVCTGKPMPCAWRACGCKTKKLTNAQMIYHIREDMLLHGELLVAYMTKKNTKVALLQESLKKFDKEIENMRNKILSDKLVLDNYKISAQNEFSEIFDYNEDVQNYNGELLWKVENFSNLLEKAKQGTDKYVLSVPFYSNEFGYKMCLKMYPYGDGQGRGTHVSLFFVIMRGGFDDILPWPFVRNIKLSIITSSQPLIGQSEIFKHDSRLTCYEKPKNNFNVGAGNPRFITHEFLKTKYVNNDSFFIMATMEDSNS